MSGLHLCWWLGFTLVLFLLQFSHLVHRPRTHLLTYFLTMLLWQLYIQEGFQLNLHRRLISSELVRPYRCLVALVLPEAPPGFPFKIQQTQNSISILLPSGRFAKPIRWSYLKRYPPVTTHLHWEQTSASTRRMLRHVYIYTRIDICSSRGSLFLQEHSQAS